MSESSGISDGSGRDARIAYLVSIFSAVLMVGSSTWTDKMKVITRRIRDMLTLRSPSNGVQGDSGVSTLGTTYGVNGLDDGTGALTVGFGTSRRMGTPTFGGYIVLNTRLAVESLLALTSYSKQRLQVPSRAHTFPARTLLPPSI